ncbi:MAG TPA: hypothetical protein VGC13_09590 [Longimicrobium sp.]|jgi:hypothetical protein|uniref:hypothetical protein n=1 Tax=Longimicrobium sp. TaxID=2029185 RepID=UPI002EDAA920
MKCIHCGTDSRRRERSAGRCPRCGHPFAFDPTLDRYKVTDTQFQSAVDRVSGGGKVQFTELSLWYEFNHRWMKPGFWRSPFGALPFVGAGSGVVAGQDIMHNAAAVTDAIVGLLPPVAAGAAAGLAVGAVLSGLANRRAPLPPLPPRMTFEAFQRDYLRRWRQVHGDVAGLLPVREVALPAMPTQVAADVAAFSFDRAVVTDRWETAQMLVANRFHFEHNCAVLSRDGYPDGTAETVKAMLRRNPALTVFALHNASAAGCLLPLTLREPEWFPDPRVRIVDLGLRPGTVRRLRVPTLRGPFTRLPPRLEEVLPPEDVAWLKEHRTVELAALRPAQVLRAAYQGIVAAGPYAGSSSGSGGDGGDTYYGGGVIWVGDLSPGADTAAVDGFG